MHFLPSLPNSSSSSLPIHRRILAKWFGIPERMDWRACLPQNPEEERAQEDRMVKAVRTIFTPFDFTE